MSVSGIQEVAIGVGHLRQQVGFYGSNLGLRVTSKGRLPVDLCRDLWNVDDALDVVVMGRPDLPEQCRLRLVRTSDLPARPDFRLSMTGPLGFAFETADIRRVYYRLSGTGVEFHSPPIEVEPPKGDSVGPRFLCLGRAYDGEYLVLQQGAEGRRPQGTLSPFFGVTEPLETLFVVPDLEPCCRFMIDALDHELVVRGHRSGQAREQSMGLAPGQGYDIAVLAPRDGLGSRTTFLSFGDPTTPPPVAPPSRGICGVRYDVGDCERRSRLAASMGAELIAEPRSVDHPALGQGWVSTSFSPFGMLIELWQASR